MVRYQADESTMAGSATPQHHVTPTITELLDFEREHQGKPGRQETISATFGLRLPRYVQLLNRAIDTPEALHHDAVTTRRLQRIRDRQERIRAERTPQ